MENRHSSFFLFLFFALYPFKGWAYLSTNVSLTSDYIWRGLTLSAHKASIQGGMDYTFEKSVFIGHWASSTENGSEADIYFGFHNEISDYLSWEFKASHMAFLQKTSESMNELSLSFQFVGFDILFSYIPQFFGRNSSALYASLERKFEITPERTYFLAGAGINQFDDEDIALSRNYFHYYLGVNTEYRENLYYFIFSDTSRTPQKDQSVFFKITTFI